MSLARPLSAVPPDQRPVDTRARIIAALNSIPGITGYSSAPDQATAGASWPRWVQTTYDGPLCTLARDSFDVLVTLPADYPGTTVDQGDRMRDVVALALNRLGLVQYVEPVSIGFQDRQTMPGLRVRLVIK